MVILGLGSNVGDRLTHLRRAFQEIKKIPGVTIQQVSPLYVSDALLPDNAPPDWDQPHLNLALRLETRIEALELLQQLKKIEELIGRKPEKRHWGPRVIDIDMLAYNELVLNTDLLTLPHPGLQERPFALWPLADVTPFWRFPSEGAFQGKTAAEMVTMWESRFNGKAPLRTRQIYQRIDTPELVGVLNVTPDSFSDGGQFLNVENAIQQAISLVQTGASIIDIGSESTAPNAPSVTAETEWARLRPLLTAIKDEQDNFIIPPKISIDTHHADVAAKALEWGVDWINDVKGLTDPAMREIMAKSTNDCVVMHSLTIPASSQHTIPLDQDSVKIVFAWFNQQLENLAKAGIAKERIILDPGIGFGKTKEQSLALIQHVSEFSKFGTRLLIGHSRKSFLSLFTHYPAQERDVESLAITLHFAKGPIDYLRVHNVEMSARGLKVARAL